MLKDEIGASEIVGILLIFSILIIFLGIIQAHEVPEWNQEIEKEHFRSVYSDFLYLKSDIENVALLNMPKSHVMSMGVTYPNRYFLNNPGTGAYGKLEFEKTNVTLKVGNNRSNYTSTRITYEMQGISSQPKLIYEHGIVIRDYGNGNSFIETSPSIVTEKDIFVPIINASGMNAISNIEPEILNIIPLPDSAKNVITNTTTLNITLETKYPALWKNATNGTSGVNVTGSGNFGFIYINKTMDALLYPKLPMPSGFYSSSITNVLPYNLRPKGSLGVHKGGTGEEGMYSNEVSADHLIDIPTNETIQIFRVDDIAVTKSTVTTKGQTKKNDTGYFQFRVDDVNEKYFIVRADFKSSVLFEDITYYTEKTGNSGISIINDINVTDKNVSKGINLTKYYKNSNISIPNSLIIDTWNDPSNTRGATSTKTGILYVRFVIY